jgi:hypothetical protein
MFSRAGRNAAIEHARLTPGSGFRVRNAVLFYGMRLVPFVGARTLVARAFSSIIGRSSQPSACYDEAALSVLRRDGVASMAPLLTSPQIAEVDAFLRNRELVGHDGTTFHLGQAPAGTQRASYPLTTTLTCPHLFAAVNNPALLAFAESYLGAKPTISAVRIDCTFPPRDGATPVQAQQFHRDYDDWRLVKVFVYISEVDDLGGPHEYVRTSHLRSGRFRATPFHREFIDREYGSGAIERIRGPRGTTFVADTFGIHRGGVPTRAVRTLFQATYSLLPAPFYDYAPVYMSPKLSVDRRASRLLVR